MRFHSQTAGVSLTAQQPLEQPRADGARGACPRCSAARSRLHTNSYDEALALPTEEAVRLALRTQQIIAHETGVTNTIDPLGGSYFVEALTDRMEQAAYEYFGKIEELGGMVEAVKKNFPQREIADASWHYQEEVDAGQRLVVGVNRYAAGRRAADRDPAHRPGARAQADRTPPGHARAPRRRGRRAHARDPEGGGRRTRTATSCTRSSSAPAPT